MGFDVFHLTIKRLWYSFFILSIAFISVSGQTHFTFTSQTGNNMTVIAQTSINPTINNQPLAKGDEIGVFTPAGLCVGARTWDSINNKAITVWGDINVTPDTTGMFSGETLSYRIWDSSLALELPATATYDTLPPATARGTYVVNGISFLATLFAPPMPQKILLVSPSNSITINVDSAIFVWLKGTPLINRYALEIATDSLMSSIFFTDSAVIDTTRTYKGFSAGTSYWWRVRAHNGSGWGIYSDTFKLTVASTAAVLPESYSLNFYGVSNARSFISYALPAPSHVSIRLYTIQGKLVTSFIDSYQAAGYHQIPANLTSLSKGFYFLSFNAGNHLIRKKLLNY
jgi:hypothetical protein